MKQVSILLGAGFSAPMGYPIGNELNNSLVNFDQHKMGISPDGKLYKLNDEQEFRTYGNPYVVYLDCCIKLIKAYAKENHFDYEEFFEFLAFKSYLRNPKYLEVIKTMATDTITIEFIASNLEVVYNQMVSYLIKDQDNNTWYDNLPYHIGKVDKYDGFLNILKTWKDNYRINVHTLNHDLLFESFNRTDYLAGEICDGFEEIGSEYYGELHESDNPKYHVRLERFTGNYNKSIRLYKLHGSLDYVLYYKTLSDGISLARHQYVKTKYGVGYDCILRDIGNPDAYERYPFAYHANFLTGTDSKIKKYEDPLLFGPLFKSFKENLESSEKLLIIGYGCKDKGINDIIVEHFKGRHILIIDPYCVENKTISDFAKRINAIMIKANVSDLRIEDIRV